MTDNKALCSDSVLFDFFGIVYCFLVLDFLLLIGFSFVVLHGMPEVDFVSLLVLLLVLVVGTTPSFLALESSPMAIDFFFVCFFFVDIVDDVCGRCNLEKVKQICSLICQNYHTVQ